MGFGALARAVQDLNAPNFAAYPDTWGLNPNSKNFADRASEVILRSQYDNWKQTFEPIENELLAAYNSPAIRQQATSRAVKLFNQGADAGDRATDRRLASYGIELSPEQQMARDRSSNLQRGLGTVNAFNQTARLVDDRNKGLLTGLSGVGRGGA